MPLRIRTLFRSAATRLPSCTSGLADHDGDSTPFVGAMTSVYVRVGDNWKLALYQQTPVTTGSSS